jgi:preprotein translocase subunit SecB
LHEDIIMADPQQSDGGAAQGAVFTIDRIYVKDLSLENPGSPQSFMTQEQPQVEVGLRTKGEQLQPDVYECVLTVTLTAKVGEKTLFLVEASQAGVFTIRGIPQDQLQPLIAVNCPSVLFPYVRETLADAVMRAGFPPVHLAPINFEALYQQQVAQMQKPTAAAIN